MTPLPVYLAAAYSKRERIRKIAKELEALGNLQITSRWLTETQGDLRSTAWMDVADIRRANIFARFSDEEYLSETPCDPKLISGARMWEQGFAYALGKKIIVIGHCQPVFDYLDSVIHFSTVAGFTNWIQEQLLERNLEHICSELSPAQSPLEIQ
jgi:hypothetical protein